MVVLFDGSGRVLLVRQSYERRVWALPGGVVEHGESPGEAAVREAREEIGVDVELDGLVGVYYLRPPRPGMRFVFAAAVTTGEPHVAAAGEIMEIAWCAPDTLPEPRALSVAYAVADAAVGKRGIFRELDRCPAALTTEGPERAPQ